MHHTPVFAEYNSEKIAEGIGAYAMAADLLENISSSECGYIVRGEYSTEKVLKEVLPYLTKEDQEKVNKFFAEEFFEKKSIQNKNDVESAILIGRQRGVGLNEICDKINSHATRIYKYGVEQWEYAKKNYSR